MTGVHDDPPRYPQAPLPVDFLEGSSPPMILSEHHSLESFAVVGGAIAVPSSDAVVFFFLEELLSYQLFSSSLFMKSNICSYDSREKIKIEK